MPRTPTAPLTRASIARAALDLLDEQGSAGWTMRALADRLGVRAPSLYSHVANQDEILDAVHEQINSEIDLDALEGDDLRTALTECARSYRAAYVRHPHATALIAHRPIGTDSALRVYDAILRTLLHHGVPAGEAMRFTAVLDYLVLGSAVETFIGGFGEPADYREAYPSLATALQACDRDCIDEEGFELGLARLVEAVAASAAR
ncbi:TetR/AcrR family transcriptional regulator [Motilibacter deserti]|uniref:TetR family transcriptional regulator n=1 Tax=Motilibacter deserti TaxID=2714956 RepID=A0ABX0GU11_9ACTN|nr:TetR/AcrR family transcriptional regulator C-terminal domain-containing protein [Motilibacter deserti]NHC13145.1 TetR family transcriptional regulator [Motilibacter deserti]